MLGTSVMSARPTKDVCLMCVRQPAKAHEAPFTPFSVCLVLLSGRRAQARVRLEGGIHGHQWVSVTRL